MTARMFEGITQEQGNVSTRRKFFRLLAGVVATGAVAATGLSETEARRRKRHRNRNTSKRRIRQPWNPALDQTIRLPNSVLEMEWILSGGPDPSTSIFVDDDLVIKVYRRNDPFGDSTSGGVEVVEFSDTNHQTDSHPPIRFMAKEGDGIVIIATDVHSWCRALSPIWLHCPKLGGKRQLFAGIEHSCAEGRTSGDFYVKKFGLYL